MLSEVREQGARLQTAEHHQHKKARNARTAPRVNPSAREGEKPATEDCTLGGCVAQQGKAPAPQPEDLSVNPGTHMVRGGNRLPQAVL